MAPGYQLRPIIVSGQLLLRRDLTASAKLMAIVLGFSSPSEQPGLRLLEDLTGLSRPGVRDALAQLAAVGLVGSAWCGPWGILPRELLFDRTLRAQPKVLYAAIQLLPGFRRPSIETRYKTLCLLTGLSPNTAKDAIRLLVAQGWIDLSQRNQLSPISLTLLNPPAERISALISQAAQRLERAPFLGEALMREWLTLLVDSDEYEDNATPGFLVNLYTLEEMQIDRYYPPRVGYEFQGPQHYGPTALYPNEEAARKQQARDFMKVGICTKRGIHLVTVHAEDLSLEGMLRKVDGLLPLRDLRGLEPLIDFLESRSRPYRRKAQARQ